MLQRFRRSKRRVAFTADVINVHPQTPNLDAMLEKFNKEL
jgi:cupin superfamily acireductone dioxygenase involved in methionine salvage